MNITKKIVASLLGLSLLALPGAVGGQTTVADLQAQIAALLAQINALQAQLAGLQGGSAAGACSFTRNLFEGVSGDDVKCLQQYLNSAGHQLAASGAGSPGNETQFYGPRTRAAVASWQAANGVAPAVGYFGPISQAKYSSLVAAAPPPPTTPPGDGITTPGAEGSMVATIESTPTSVTMNIKSTGVSVAAVKVKATGSDVKVDRFDVNFNARPWLYVASITVTDGTTSRTLAVSSANSTEITVGSSYDVRVDGLNLIIPKDTSKVLTVKVDAVSGLPGTETTKDVVLTFAANAIRGTDGANIQQYAPTSALATRTFTVKQGDTASVEISAHTDNPKARPVIVKSTTETTDVVLAVFNAKATGNDAILRTLEVRDSTASTTGPIDILYLYDGSTLLSSTSTITSASATLTNINLTIPKDTTKVLTLKGTIRKAQGNYQSAGSSTIDAGVASSNITVGADSLSFAAEDATSFATATVTGSDVTPQAAYYYVKAPTLSLASTSVTGLTAPSGSLTPQQAEAKIRVNITANGGDIFIPQFDSAASASNGIAAATTTASVTQTGETITSNAEVAVSNALWVVRSGDTKYFEFIGTLTDDTQAQSGMTTTGKTAYVQVSDLRWGTTQAEGLGNGLLNWPDTDFWTNFKTSAIFLQAPN